MMAGAGGRDSKNRQYETYQDAMTATNTSVHKQPNDYYPKKQNTVAAVPAKGKEGGKAQKIIKMVTTSRTQSRQRPRGEGALNSSCSVYNE